MVESNWVLCLFMSQVYEQILVIKQEEVESLQCQVSSLENADHVAKVTAKKEAIAQRFSNLSDPLQKRRTELEAQQKGLQVLRDLDDEKVCLQLDPWLAAWNEIDKTSGFHGIPPPQKKKKNNNYYFF